MKRLAKKEIDSIKHADIDISPLIDIVFILLIFFILSAVFVDNSGVEINRPVANSAKALSQNTITFSLSANGKIFFAGQECNLNSVKSIMIRELYKKSVPVTIIADKNSNTGMLINLIDECKLAGAKNIAIASEVQKNKL